MKHLFTCFFFFILLIVYSLTAYSLERPVDSNFTLQASVTDTYEWSEKNQKYNLQGSRFNFRVSQEDVSNIVYKNSITDNPKKEVRYLSVQSPTVVHFESVVGASVGQKKSVRAQMSEENESLSVYFSEKSKRDILNKMLSAAKVNFSIKGNQSVSSSPYNCHIDKGKLVCSINYVLKGNFKLNREEDSSSI